MDETTTETPNGGMPNADGAPPVDADAFVEEELLIEEISIDGMCGVY